MRHFIVGVFFLGIWGMTFLFSEIPFVPAEFEGVAEHEGEKRPVQVSLVPTFESCGVYVRFEEVDGIAVCTAEYQKKGETSWQKSFPLVTDSSLKIFKGSLVFLAENEDYDIRIIFLDEQGKKRGVIKSSFKTWSSALSFSKILHVKDLLDSSGFLNLNDLRSDPGEWTKIVGDGEILKGTTDQDAAVWVKNCSRLVLENLKIMGGTRYGIHLQNSQDVRVLNCDISGFGRKGVQDISKDGKFYFPDGTYLNYDPGIFIDQSLNVVVERCYIHDPRGTANCWKYSHPAGPEAVFVRSLGGTVIRYNDFIGSDVHRWNDVIEGFENGSPLGGFYRDSDIYGNMLAFANDDCVELDGGQMNVRLYRNRLEGALTGVSVVPCLLGPSYVFQNLILDLGDEYGAIGTGVKTGGGDTFAKGRVHVIHNTIFAKMQGIGGGGYGTDKNREMYQGFSRNNLIQCERYAIYDPEKFPANDFDFDFLSTAWITPGIPQWKAGEGKERHGIMEKPVFENEKSGKYQLVDSSPGKKTLLPIEGFIPQEMEGKVDPGVTFGSGVNFLPYRPIPLVPDKLRIFLNVDLKSPEAAKETMTVKVTAEPNWTGNFHIAKNEAMEWLKVTPTSGIFKGGETTEFTVGFKGEEGEKSVGLKRGIFMIRLDDGYSIPISCYMNVYSHQYEKWMRVTEMEANGLPEIFQKIPHENGMYYPEGYKMEEVSLSDFKKKNLSMDVEIPEEGNYYIFVHMKPSVATKKEEGIYLSIDQGKFEKIPKRELEEWRWIPCSPHGGKNEGVYDRPWKGTAGKHTLHWAFASSALIDGVLITTDPLAPESSSGGSL